MKYFLVLVLTVFTACNGQKKVSGENTGQKSDLKAETSMTLLLQDYYSGSETPETLVIKDVKALKAFFSKINRTRKPGLPVPEVDFSKHMVIIYCGGLRNDGGFPKLSLTAETDNQLVFKPTYPTVKDKSKFTAATSPFCVYKMPFTDKAITIDLTK